MGDAKVDGCNLTALGCVAKVLEDGILILVLI